MTTITRSASLKYYSYRRLDKNVVDAFHNHALLSVKGSIAKRINISFILFECYCDITNNHISFASLSSKKFIEICEGFIGALASEEFVDQTKISRHQLIKIFALTLTSLKSEIPALSPHEWSATLYDEMTQCWEESKKRLDDNACLYWSGWTIKSREGHETILRIPELWNSHGKEFACKVFQAYKLQFEKQSRPLNTLPNRMIVYISENSSQWPANSFTDPIEIDDFFKSFMRDYFIERHTNGFDVNSAIKAWSTFVNNVHQAFIDKGYWVPPFTNSLPRAAIKASVNGIKTNVKKKKDGSEVQTKLITEIPLKCTDEEAIEILFHEVNQDVSIVRDWAEYFANDLYQKYTRRIRLSEKGTVQTGGNSGKKFSEIGLVNLCATYEQSDYHAFSGNKNTQVRLFGYETKYELAKIIGLPTTNTLYPFMLLLVNEHPKITTTFLTDFTLYDKENKLVGFTKSGDGYQLMGYKRRRGKKNAQQKIQLTEKAAKIVKQVIEITSYLRNHCKRNNDDKWRYLFLTCGQAFSKPMVAKPPSWSPSGLNQTNFIDSKNKFVQILKELNRPHDKKAVLDFMSRISLSTLRASRGIEIYLETGSVDEMAEALGHACYRTGLLSHYLPEPILAFFQTRWIRIFQKAFICEAMKLSPYLLRATNFESMEELHEFLSNHRMKDIPRHLSNPSNDRLDSDRNNGHVLISIDAGILTALISLEQAVDLSPTPNQVNGLAKYWSQICKNITVEISRGDDSLLVEHLNTALMHADPERMMRMIHEPTS